MIQAIRETPILMYHSISDTANSEFADFIVPPARFKEQIEYLDAEGYTTLTVTELATAIIEGQSLPERRVLLTFDDAFVDFSTQALPVLERFGCRATLYIPTAYVGKTSQWMATIGEGDRPILDWDSLKQLPESIECGAHSHTHPQMDLLNRADAHEEVFLSKKIVESKLERTIHSFCYPHGFSNRMVRRLVQAAGFTAACAGLMPTDDLYALPRLLVKPDMDVTQFSQLLASKPSMAERRLRPVASVAFRLVRQMRQHTN